MRRLKRKDGGNIVDGFRGNGKNLALALTVVVLMAAAVLVAASVPVEARAVPVRF